MHTFRAMLLVIFIYSSSSATAGWKPGEGPAKLIDVHLVDLAKLKAKPKLLSSKCCLPYSVQAVADRVYHIAEAQTCTHTHTQTHTNTNTNTNTNTHKHTHTRTQTKKEKRSFEEATSKPCTVNPGGLLKPSTTEALKRCPQRPAAKPMFPTPVKVFVFTAGALLH